LVAIDISLFLLFIWPGLVYILGALGWQPAKSLSGKGIEREGGRRNRVGGNPATSCGAAAPEEEKKEEEEKANEA
jgi:hypothetical protein